MNRRWGITGVKFFFVGFNTEGWISYVSSAAIVLKSVGIIEMD